MPWLFMVWLVGLWCVFMTPLVGAAPGVVVRSVDLSVQHEHYQISVDIDYLLSNTAKEALHNGIPLFWDVIIKLERQRNWLWNETLATRSLRYRIQYLALINRFKVSNLTADSSESFATLASALANMAMVRRVDLLVQQELKPEEKYQVAVKVRFDREALPLPLRPIAYLNSQWNLSSAWYLWPVKK